MARPRGHHQKRQKLSQPTAVHRMNENERFPNSIHDDPKEVELEGVCVDPRSYDHSNKAIKS